jgi:hypothetical protein
MLMWTTMTSLLPSSSHRWTLKLLEPLRLKTYTFPCKTTLLRKILSVTTSNINFHASALSRWVLLMLWASICSPVRSWMLAMETSSKPLRPISSKTIKRPSQTSTAYSRSFWIKSPGESRPLPVACKPTQSWISQYNRPRHRKPRPRGTISPRSYRKTTRRFR